MQHCPVLFWASHRHAWRKVSLPPFPHPFWSGASLFSRQRCSAALCLQKGRQEHGASYHLKELRSTRSRHVKNWWLKTSSNKCSSSACKNMLLLTPKKGTSSGTDFHGTIMMPHVQLKSCNTLTFIFHSLSFNRISVQLSQARWQYNFLVQKKEKKSCPSGLLILCILPNC